MTLYRWVTFGLAVIGLIVWVYWIRIYKKPGYAIMAILWLIHVAVFSISRLFYGWPLEVLQVNIWSSIIRIHALITLIGCGLIMIHDAARPANE